MAYTPTLWAKGDKVTSEKLNKIEQGIVDKMDKVDGKGLSTNDYTNQDKAKLDGLESQIDHLESLVGSPLVASTAAEMTNEDKVYVYTGNETGYQNGYWYYYDGTAWTQGGVYNSAAINVDDTLSISGAPADSKKTGDEIADLKSEIGDLSQLNTENKSNLVAAINEAATTGGGTVSYDLPKLTIYGDISVSNKDAETKAYQYVWENPAENEQRTGYCSLKWQGESSLTYPKKNYTIKFYADAKYKRKDKQSFFDKLILVKNKWVLKAHWVDRSMARNIVSCRLWGQMVKSRNGAPEEHLAQAPNFGSINGFPIKVYVNDEFHGLYDFNIPKDADLFAMDEENPLHCAICGDSQSANGPTAFRSTTSATTAWELEVPDTWQSYTVEEDGQTVTKQVSDGLINLINFVMTATDADFKAHLNDYLDVESAIDYYLMCYLNCGIDSLGRNLLMVTYDGGNKWYASLYDADTTWGNGTDGNQAYNAQRQCPEEYLMKTSLLWERLEACFGNELYERWSALRTNIFSEAYLKNEFALFWNLIPEQYFDMDVEKWSTIPQWNVNFKQKIKTFISERLPYCDTQIRAMREAIPCTGITLSESAISFSSGTPVTLTATVTPENTTDDVVWNCSDSTVCTVSNGIVTPLKNGTATITAACGTQSATCSVTVSGLLFTISLSGAHATLTGTGTVNPNSSYTGTLTADTGYEFESVTVTMGSTDITATAYSNGTVSIASVTGDVVVTVVAVLSEDTTGLQYKLASPFTINGTSYLDTEFLYNSTDPLTIAVDMTMPDDVSTSGLYAFGAMRSASYTAGWVTSSRTINGVHHKNLSSGLPATARLRVKAVLRYNATTGVISMRSSCPDAITGSIVEKTTTNSHSSVTVNAVRDAFTTSMYIGGLHGANGLESAAQSGTIHDMRILTRRWTDAEVKYWLGVTELSTVITDDLDAASTTYTVTLSGSGATLSPTSNVIAGSAYNGTLTADSGYTIDSVSVKMDGVDITATAYSSGTVTISSVTGNIVVTVVTSSSGPVIDPTDLEYALPSAFTLDGTSYLDTGFVYNSTDPLTIAIDFTQPTDMSTGNLYALGAMQSGTNKCGWITATRRFANVHHQSQATGLPATAGLRVKAVLRYNATTGVMSTRSSCPDSVTGDIVEKTTSNSHITISSTNPTRDAFVNSLYIGGLHGANGLESAAQSGTLHDVRIYTRRWTDAEVATWLGLESLSDVFTDDKDA